MNYTYKAVISGPQYSNTKESRNNRKRLETPEIEHNFPEEMIVNINDIKSFRTGTIDSGKYFSKQNVISISESEFNSLFEGKIFYQSNEQYNITFKPYIGCVLIRNFKGFDILTFVGKVSEYTDRVILLPIHVLKHENIYNEYLCPLGVIPKRNVKCFTSKEDLLNQQKEAAEKSEKRWKTEVAKMQETNKMAPVFSLKTPKFRVVEISKKTDYLKNIKVGDIIYGEIPVIKSTDERKFGALRGIGTLTNWVTLYVNDEKVNTISPKVFPNLFLINIIVEEVK